MMNALFHYKMPLDFGEDSPYAGEAFDVSGLGKISSAQAANYFAGYAGGYAAFRGGGSSFIGGVFLVGLGYGACDVAEDKLNGLGIRYGLAGYLDSFKMQFNGILDGIGDALFLDAAETLETVETIQRLP